MKRLYRDRFDKKLAGVSGGLGQYFQVDSSIIRLIFIAATLATAGLFFLIYLLLWAILPLGPICYIEAHYKKLYRSTTNRYVAGLCGGLGEYFKIDPNIIRLLFLLLLFITGFVPLAIAYIIGIGIVPEKPGSSRF